MPDYSKGKVYTIRCRTDTSLIYIGSTINPLSKRWGEHKSRGNNIYGKHYNFYIYTTIRNNGGFSNFYIELYESYSCENKEQLHKREGEVIRLLGTLNSRIEGRTQKEWFNEHKEETKEYLKIYHEENKEAIKLQRSEHYIEHRQELLEKKKIYYIEHKEELNEKKKIYREENKEEIKEYLKKYREENKEEIEEKRKIKYTCECGSTLTIQHKLRHENSKKHLKFIENK